MKILVIRFSSLGDVILTTPALLFLRKKHPKAKIIFLTNHSFYDVISSNPFVDDCISFFGQSLKSLSLELNKLFGFFDLVVDLHNSLRSNILLHYISYQKKVVYKKPYIKRWLYVYFKINLFKKVKPIARQYIDILPDAEGDFKTTLPYIKVNKPSQKKLLNLDSNKKILVLGIGAKWFNKIWPREYFETLLSMLDSYSKGYQVVLLGGQSEEIIGDNIIKYSHEKNLKISIINYAGKLSILESTYILSISQVLLSNDSALVHLALGFNIYILVLYLSTVPEFGFFPYSKKSDYLSEKLKCKPCDHKGKNHCPKQHFRCAYLLTPEKSIYQIRKVFKE